MIVPFSCTRQGEESVSLPFLKHPSTSSQMKILNPSSKIFLCSHNHNLFALILRVKLHFKNTNEIRFAQFGAICTILKTWKRPIEACYTQRNTPPWVFYTFFKLHKWYQIAQNITTELWTIQESPLYITKW